MLPSTVQLADSPTNKIGIISVSIFGSSVIYKLSTLKDVFYISIRNDWGLTNTEIGLGLTFYAITQTLGYLMFISMCDKFFVRYLLSFGLIGVSICGIYLASLPPFPAYVIVFCFLSLFGRVVYWPSLLKTFFLLGKGKGQKRLFSLLESGRGVADIIVTSAALSIFIYCGKGREGLQAVIMFYSILTAGTGVVTYLIMRWGECNLTANTIDRHDVKYIFINVKVLLSAFSFFFVYLSFIGITYFIPYLEYAYGASELSSSVYGIINQYGLKIIGGVLGGIVVTCFFSSVIKYLSFSFVIISLLAILIGRTSIDSVNMYVGICGMAFISVMIFTQRAVFFSIMEEIGISSQFAASAMTIACLIGYLPSLFGYTLYGYLLDKFPGHQGYTYIFYFMSGSAGGGVICSSVLASILYGNNKQ